MPKFRRGITHIQLRDVATVCVFIRKATSVNFPMRVKDDQLALMSKAPQDLFFSRYVDKKIDFFFPFFYLVYLFYFCGFDYWFFFFFLWVFWTVIVVDSVSKALEFLGLQKAEQRNHYQVWFSHWISSIHSFYFLGVFSIDV